MTFIAGPHKCIGMQMAMLVSFNGDYKKKRSLNFASQELKAMLCSLVSHFEFIHAQNLPKETSAITMKPDGGVLVRLKKLDPADSIKSV